MSPTSADIVRGSSIVILPLGSWEQHGAHLPLDTDTRIVGAIVEAALALVECSEFVVAPALAVTASDEHAGFPGTLSAGTEATTSTIVAVARSAAWARGVCIVNGHGGNADALSAAHHALEHERIPHAVWSPSAGDHDDLHAGRTETSLMLHIDPSVVRLDRIEPGATPGPDAIAAMRAGGVAAVSANGVLGDPTGATAEEGRLILDRCARSLADRLVACTRRWPTAGN